jgi:hypothetical protein
MSRHRAAGLAGAFSSVGAGKEAGERKILWADSVRALCRPICRLGSGCRGGDFLSKSFLAGIAEQYRQLHRLLRSYDLFLLSRAMHVDQAHAALPLNDLHPQVRPIGNSELR